MSTAGVLRITLKIFMFKGLGLFWSRYSNSEDDEQIFYQGMTCRDTSINVDRIKFSITFCRPVVVEVEQTIVGLIHRNWLFQCERQ